MAKHRTLGYSYSFEDHIYEIYRSEHNMALLPWLFVASVEFLAVDFVLITNGPVQQWYLNYSNIRILYRLDSGIKFTVRPTYREYLSCP